MGCKHSDVCLQPMSHFTNKYIFTCLILLLSGAYKLIAQTENWDSYLATVSGKPASVLVDLGLFSTAPDKRYPFVVITGPQTQTLNDKGIPNKMEIKDLEQILDVTTNFITGITARVLAGTFTYNNERLNYYYVKDTTGVRNAILRVYNRNFKAYKFVINIKPDPQWLNYLTFLYPSEAALNLMENNKVIMQLLQSGDSLRQKRDIRFATCFKTDTARAAFATYLTEKGYTLQKSPLLKKSEYPLCQLFSRFGSVKADSISIITAEIKLEAKKHNGLYSGWDATLK